MQFTPQAFTGANVFIDGLGALGILKTFEPPKLEYSTIEATASIGKYEKVLPSLKPLNAKMVLTNINPVLIAPLSTLLPKVLYIKQNMTSTGITQEDTQIIATMGGVIKVGELPTFEMEKEVEFSLEMSVYTFTYQVNKVPLIVYDVVNSVYAINGIDQFASIRENIT
ncbi:phage major tail tube protein [Helicobacter sp. faydin-H20]|uniref:phage major tail tube protein n=1 Tax=Helicobacter anatolicus TaxID=2905874 RepID=UPI001E307CDF|nr:phage major tail tube protein [Helicobacter anatolicus]MCE3037523.1 phage major tail tube protein [Helicobacter anatolicus]